jgi:hypothetical protein
MRSSSWSKESVALHRDQDLPVQHEAAGSEAAHSLHQLGKVPPERLPRLGADLHLVPVAEDEASEAVPLRLVLPTVAARDLRRGGRLHRRIGGGYGELHRPSHLRCASLGGRAPPPPRIGRPHVGELALVLHASQQEATTAHVAAPHERLREEEPVAQHLEQDLQVLPRGNAAEEHDLVGGAELLGQRLDTRHQRLAVAGLRGVDRHAGEVVQVVRPDHRVRRQKAPAGGDDKRLDGAGRRPAEGGRIGQLAAEVQGAHEGEDLAERRTTLPEPQRQGEVRLLAKEGGGPLAGSAGGGEEEDAVRAHAGRGAQQVCRDGPADMPHRGAPAGSPPDTGVRVRPSGDAGGAPCDRGAPRSHTPAAPCSGGSGAG